MEFHRNQRVLDAYVIDALLGRGSMSVVYAAHREDTEEIVAIKVLTQSQKYPVLRRRFEREARLLKEVGRHPHIVELIDHGILESGVPCIVMEYIDGETLRQMIYEDQAIPWGRVAHYAKQLCEGLASVHRRGILHRDIKPSNV
ncbi:MAG: serine/threonine-protein kinase, partial [Myxococcota bacterium]